MYACTKPADELISLLAPCKGIHANSYVSQCAVEQASILGLRLARRSLTHAPDCVQVNNGMGGNMMHAQQYQGRAGVLQGPMMMHSSPQRSYGTPSPRLGSLLFALRV